MSEAGAQGEDDDNDPIFDPFIYQNVGNDKMDDLGTYLQWHRDHPYCSTPRAPRRGVESQIAAGTTFWCDEDSEYAGKVYIKFSPKKESDIPEEFNNKPIGGAGDFDEVSTTVKKYEDFLRYNDYDFDDFEDPWWNMSVKDQRTHAHIDDDSVYEGMINDGSDILRMKKERDQREVEQNKAFIETGQRNLTALAMSKGWGQRPRVRKSAWDAEVKRTRYTENGQEALKEYSLQARQLKVAAALDEYHSAESSDIMGVVTGMSEAEVKHIRTMNRFKEELGGLEATEKMSEAFIEKAVYNRKHMDKGYSVFEGGMDFLDACTKVNAFKAVALLKLGAEPNTVTPEDEPVLVMILRKIIVADAMKSATDDKGDKEREKCFKILKALVKHGVNLESFVGNEKPLHIVASAGHKELASWLVDNGAVPDSRTKGIGSTAMMLAAKFGHADTIAELLLRDASLKTQDFHGRTCLHYSAEYGQTRCSRFLLKIGVNQRVKDKDLNTAAALATSNGYAVTAQVIMGYAADFQLGKPVIEFIDNELHGPKKPKEPKNVFGKIGEFFGSLFGSTTNADGTVKRGCLAALGEKISGWKERYDDFELKDLFKKKQNVVFPDEDGGGGGEEEVPEEPVFEF